MRFRSVVPALLLAGALGTAAPPAFADSACSATANTPVQSGGVGSLGQVSGYGRFSCNQLHPAPYRLDVLVCLQQQSPVDASWTDQTCDYSTGLADVYSRSGSPIAPCPLPGSVWRTRTEGWIRSSPTSHYHYEQAYSAAIRITTGGLCVI